MYNLFNKNIIVGQLFSQKISTGNWEICQFTQFFLENSNFNHRGFHFQTKF